MDKEWPAGPIKKAIVGITLEYESRPVVILKADRIFRDYQRRGFFRIGTLPLLVLDGLTYAKSRLIVTRMRRTLL